ncbi:MAG: glycosyltransferase family 39 protein [Proteobacteria bacterium]|nr:glycosyltransferase family 39 protein [Pseudomonadota bacterium]
MLVFGLMCIHVVLWTLAPALSFAGLPLDVLEGYAVGREWAIGHIKHPSLPWWLLEASRLVTGTVGWPAYCLSAVSIALTYWIVFNIGRELLGERRAAAGTLLLTANYFFSWVTPEFNHNVLQMPLWVAAIWALLRARSTASASSWLAFGLVAAIGLYAKLSSSVLIATCIGSIAWDPALRRQIATWRPWLAALVFAIVAAPLILWLAQTEFSALAYVRGRAGARGAGIFIAKLLGISLGSIALFAFAVAGRGWPNRMNIAEPGSADRAAASTLGYFLLVPILLSAVGSLVTGSGLKSAWAAPMLSLTGMLLVALWPTAVDERFLRRLALPAFLILIALPIVYGATSAACSIAERAAPRVCWPEREIARRLEAIWQGRTGRPLRVVVGDTWTGAMVSVLGKERANLLFDGDFTISPSVTPEMIETNGALVVWGQAPMHPPAQLRWLIGEHIDGMLSIPITRSYEGQVWYTIVPPGPLPPVPKSAGTR